MPIFNDFQASFNKLHKIEKEDNVMHLFSLCNFLIFFIVLISALIILMFDDWITYFNYVYSLLFLVSIVTFLLIRNKYYLFAQTFFLISSIVLISVFTLCVGNDNGLEFALIIYLISSVFLYKKKKYIFFIASICSLSFFSTEVYFYMGNTHLIDLPPSLATKILLFISLLFSLSFILYYVMNRNYVFQENLQSLLNQKKAQNSKLEQANSELENFTYIASHDLKTPLRTINSFVGLIEKKINKKEYDSIQEYIDFVKRGSNKMYQIIEDILNVVQVNYVQDMQYNNIDLNKIVEDAKEILQDLIKTSNAKVEYQNLAEIKGPKSEFTLVFQNLIENGIKYNNSKIPVVSIRSELDNTKLYIYIEDNGIGIPEEYKSTVFSMFKRLHTSDVYEGTGMGLAISKKIIGKLNGKIFLQKPIKGKGSVFVIELPKL